MPSFHESMVSGNTAFTFRQGLQKEGRAVVTLPPRFVLGRHADVRTDGINIIPTLLNRQDGLTRPRPGGRVTVSFCIFLSLMSWYLAGHSALLAFCHAER